MRKATMEKTFTNFPTAESWLRWNGFTRYVGMWTYQTEDGSSEAVLRHSDDGQVRFQITKV